MIARLDSAFGSRKDESSQMGSYAVLRDTKFLLLKEIKLELASKRVAKSTLAAEAIAFSECIDIAHHARSMRHELSGSKTGPRLSLIVNLRMMLQELLKRRLRVEIACIGNV